jgi:hypothetical protein
VRNTHTNEKHREEKLNGRKGKTLGIGPFERKYKKGHFFAIGE